MQERRSYKVLAPIPRSDGTGDWFMKVGSGSTNKDASINIYVDAVPTGQPRGLRLQLRELDEDDLRQREANRAKRATRAGPATDAPGATAAATMAHEATPSWSRGVRR